MAQLKLKPLSQLCRRMSISLRAGVDIRRVCDSEAQRGAGEQQTRLSMISRRVAGGESLADAVRDCDYFPRLFCEMVDVGEQTGTLDAVLLELAEHYEHIIALRKSFLMGIAWPVTSLVLSVGIIGLLILVIGMIGTGQDVLGLGLGPIGSFAAFLTVVASVGALIAVPSWLVWRGRLAATWMRQVTKIPVLGRTLELMTLARVAWSLSLAHGAGMEIRPAVRLSLAGSQNSLYASQAEEIDRLLEAGNEVHQAFRQTGIFPGDFLDVVETGETAGSLPESLVHLAGDYRQRAQASTKILVTVASFVVWFVVAVFLIIMIIHLFKTLYLAPIQDALEPL